MYVSSVAYRMPKEKECINTFFPALAKDQSGIPRMFSVHAMSSHPEDP